MLMNFFVVEEETAKEAGSISQMATLKVRYGINSEKNYLINSQEPKSRFDLLNSPSTCHQLIRSQTSFRFVTKSCGGDGRKVAPY